MLFRSKADKLSKQQVADRRAALARDLGVTDDQVVTTSADKGLGRDELAAAIVSLVEAPSWR